jgi:transposase
MKTNITATAQERTELEALIGNRNTPTKVVWRAEIVLATADGNTVKGICRATDKHLDLHLIVDNDGTHSTPEVMAWLAKHPRFHLHFIPTSSSWLNLVERFFAEITMKRIRRGVFRSVAELEDAFHDYLDHHNADPKPFHWTKTANQILDAEAPGLEKRPGLVRLWTLRALSL